MRSVGGAIPMILTDPERLSEMYDTKHARPLCDSWASCLVEWRIDFDPSARISCRVRAKAEHRSMVSVNYCLCQLCLQTTTWRPPRRPQPPAAWRDQSGATWPRIDVCRVCRYIVSSAAVADDVDSRSCWNCLSLTGHYVDNSLNLSDAPVNIFAE